MVDVVRSGPMWMGCLRPCQSWSRIDNVESDANVHVEVQEHDRDLQAGSDDSCIRRTRGR